jgi:hypothetical protein
MGMARAAVGAALVAFPERALRVTPRSEVTGESALLMRTIGVRDVVIGLGTLSATLSGGDDEVRRWLFAGLRSDSLDAVVGLSAARSIGWRETVVAAGSAATFVVLDVLTIRSSRIRPPGEEP